MEVKNEPLLDNINTEKPGALPAWLLEKETFSSAGRSSGGFLTHTLKSLADFLQHELLSERFAGVNGMLQAVDPRLKLVTILFFMVYTGAARSVFTVVMLIFAASALVYLSKLGLWAYFKRVWLYIPVIVLLLSLPAATNLIVPGRPLVYLFGGSLYISADGAAAVTRAVLRTGASLSFAYLLVMTTRWSYVTRSLRIFKVPLLFISLLDMTYRYIFVLVRTAEEIFEARLKRTVGDMPPQEGRKLVSSGIGLLFIKSGLIGEEVYDSMLCRCFSGEPAGLTRFRLTANDFIWLVTVAFIFLVTLLF